MFPTINGKTINVCTEEDLRLIINNPDYKESKYIDYKKCFSIDSIPKEKTKPRQDEIAEFRSDVCAFANADGGYLIFGVQEDNKGVPLELTGINIEDENTDKFELNIKTYLQAIQPKIPNIKTSFIKLLNGKYIVVLFITHDMFAPYIHLVDEKDYRIYKRINNSKVAIAYSELKVMFTQNLVLEKEIDKFRKERVDYYRNQEDIKDNFNKDMFLLLHYIPENFMDTSYNQPLFVLEKNGVFFSSVFNGFECNNWSRSMVEGLLFPGWNSSSEGRMYNNGIAEIFFPLKDFLNFANYTKGFFPTVYFWDKIKCSVRDYSKKIKDVFGNQRVFICMSIIGCKEVATQQDYTFGAAKIDRNCLLCSPVVFESISTEETEMNIKKLFIEYNLSLGIKNSAELNKTVQEVYGK